jgi:ABC-type transport system involved in cytochrome bd biosynthesis fused ATPase/permease subunit
MLALVLVIGSTAVALAGLLMILLFLLVRVASMSPEQRMMRERRRHAERTARSMQRMSEIRRQTLARMDRAERRRS